MTLPELIAHCGHVAERELIATGDCSSTFAAVDPAGKLIVFSLPPIDLALLQTMLRVYCTAFQVQQYAVTTIMWARPEKPEDPKTETLVVTACSASQQVMWTRDISRSAAGKPTLGPAQQEKVTEGYLTDLIPKQRVSAQNRQLVHTLWRTQYEPMMATLMDRSGNN